jgi:hypothetical protein
MQFIRKPNGLQYILFDLGIKCNAYNTYVLYLAYNMYCTHIRERDQMSYPVPVARGWVFRRGCVDKGVYAADATLSYRYSVE